MLSLILYPEPAASIAIFALAFGDGIASLAGKVLRGPVDPLHPGQDPVGHPGLLRGRVPRHAESVTAGRMQSLVIAAAAAILEAIPAGNFDNLVVPLGVGFLADRLLSLP